ncbi:divergent polysaccharide deacetylase family protein [Pseudoprimorskyibacter insulae]|uniref:Divergent polysaccharide deacetylase n=1 Tax=Pseudoprimorskyibacter insulae TaxID=1695997 RepID=A0A2R8AXY1_9RHOB|nr:divergent polysaccharide deacetylase family protein [Pseudoprimorskyibacter insulae]SPF80724.1 hypothetical protein PRI8871_02535 [Pseudoprimorskyibacter insulae]
MARGFLGGLLVGTSVAAVVAGGASLMIGLPERLKALSAPRPIVEPAPMTESELADAPVGEAPVAPAPDAAIEAAPMAEMDTNAVEEASPIAPEAQAAAPKPKDADVVSEPTLPSESALPVASATGDETPESPAPAPMPVAEAQDVAPDAQVGAAMPAVGDAPAMTDAPQTVEAVPVVENAQPAAPERISVPQAPATQAPEALPTAQVTPPPAVQQPEPATAPEVDALAAPPATIVAPDPAPAPIPAPVVTPDVAVVAPDPVAPATIEPDMPEADPAPVIRRPSGETAPRIGRPAGTLTDREGAVPTGRLPSIGTAAAPEAPPSDGSLPLDDVDPNAPPLVKFAEPIEVDPALPRMAIVLLHDANSSVGPEALAAFPIPVTVAVDATMIDATAIMQAYRAQGVEVLAVPNIPQGALPADIEVALAATLNAVPESVGIMEGVGAGFQATREMAEQVAEIALSSGHGLVMQPKGLNTAQSLAAKNGVPSASVFRDFDGAGQDGRVIRRFLDQAAFRARNETGGVVMLGRMQPDTLSSLVIWGLQDRAGTIAMVPVSMVLSDQ